MGNSTPTIPEYVPSSPQRPTLKYDLTVNQIVDHSLRVKPFGIDPYYPPKMERAYLLKPYFGKQNKANPKTFADLEANSHKFVPGPIYNTAFDWSKDFPHGKGRFLKGERTLPEE